MNKKYYLQYIEELTNAKNELSALINLQHLDTEDLAKLENKFSNPIKNFFKKSNRNSLRIEGYLRGAKSYNNNLENIDKKSYFTKNSSVKNINHKLPRYKNNSLIHISDINKDEYDHRRNEIVRNNDNNGIFSHNDYQ